MSLTTAVLLFVIGVCIGLLPHAWSHYKRRATKSEADDDYVECTWSDETEDGCPYCTGEACAMCENTNDEQRCDHDFDERHRRGSSDE